NNWIQARAGDRVSVQGGEAQPLEIRGPLISAGGNAGSGPLIDRQLSVNTSVVWRGGQLMGIPFGPSRMAVNLKNSVASITTSDFAFAGGTIRLNPRVNMAGNRPVLMVGRGAILEKIDLTPEMCG
ncbi:MAG: hypothetical protein GTO62_14550, partial [Planctomycetales bacterium]|nr:hypothetical protein [Planctomycetales bacterium]